MAKGGGGVGEGQLDMRGGEVWAGGGGAEYGEHWHGMGVGGTVGEGEVAGGRVRQRWGCGSGVEEVKGWREAE